MENPNKYDVYIDYCGYIIDPTSFRVFPAPLMGSRFSTGRMAYQNLDFWQVGAMTDFTKGMNQKFMVDPSQSYYSEGIDVSKEGELKLERDLENIAAFPTNRGKITAQYRTGDTLYLGTDIGWILKTIDGIAFTDEKDTGTGQIYDFYEMKTRLFATKGSKKFWVKEDDVWLASTVSQEFITIDDVQEGALYNTSKQAESFKVSTTQDTFNALSFYLRKQGTLAADLTIRIETDDDNKPSGILVHVDATLTIPKGDITTSWQWLKKSFVNKFRLEESTKYWIVMQTSGGDGSNCYLIGYILGKEANYENGNGSFYQVGPGWMDKPTQDICFKLFQDTIKDLYFVEAESETAFGLFGDGIRQTEDGISWTPEPPDPLWELPSSEGVALNFISISNGGWLVGAKRGLWNFRAGGSAVPLWSFPDYASNDNFRGMAKFLYYGVFSVEKQGVWFTEGSGVFQTNLNWIEEPFKTKSCKSLISSGWDMFGLISNGTDWYLARCTLIKHKTPQYWWIVKKLTKEPQMLSSFSDEKVFIHYVDKTCDVFNKVSGKYQAEGHLITPLIDESLVLLQKSYRSISAILSDFPEDTKVLLSSRLKEGDSFSTEKEFEGSSVLSLTKILANPTMGNRIQMKVKLKTTDTAKTPVVTDLLWRYILERPKEEVNEKRVWHFTVLAQDELEKRDFDKEELGRDEARERQDILDDIWATKSKKEILNYVGADNVSRAAFEMEYTGVGDSCLIKIDRTNYQIKTYVDGSLDKTFSYEDKTVTALVSEIDLEGDYTATIEKRIGSAELANDLMPDKDLEIKGTALIYLGSDVHSVIFASQSPGQYKLGIEGRGGDRLNISLRSV